ncbi:hypothetical protein GQX74_008353 [Glossina fuscipes]|nr:hypothetical protein GQX74_008353 [Glossina fuscipes]
MFDNFYHLSASLDGRIADGTSLATAKSMVAASEIDVLTLGSKEQEALIAERNKRTIGLLRELFPDITKDVATDTQIDLSAINKQLEETIRVARQIKEAEAAAQAAAAALQQQQAQPKSDDTIQLSFNNEVSPLNDEEKTKNINNNELQLNEPKSPALDDLTLDSSEDTVDLDDRNKRFLPVASGTNSAGGNAGGAGAAGSGNFLFDVVRLFSGSVQTQSGDANANSVSGSSDSDGDSDANRANDGYTEGIPGPVTRLVVLANRGLANLIQDLILRVAATSEKFVNFKAKLITALI